MTEDDTPQVQALKDAGFLDYTKAAPGTFGRQGHVTGSKWVKEMWQKHRIVGKTRSFLGVSGKIQSEDGVVHLVVDKLWPPRLQRQPARVGARDFQ